MALSLLHLLGFGSDRAIANAGREMLRRRNEDRLIEDLVDALAHARYPSGHRCGQGEPRPDRRRGTAAPRPDTLARPWRLDYTTSDEPGALAAAVLGLWELGITLGPRDVRPGAAGKAVVGQTVALPPWLDVPAVEFALRRLGASEVRAVPLRCETGTRPAA